MEGAIYRTDRHGRRSFVTSPATKRALAVLEAATARHEAAERAALKARQGAGHLNVSERVLRSVFGDI